MTTKTGEGRETPRTDAATIDVVDTDSGKMDILDSFGYWVRADFCRMLERDLSAMTGELDGLETDMQFLGKAMEKLINLVSEAYAQMCPALSNWPDRHSAYGQRLLCDLRDTVAYYEAREPQDVQDDYGNETIRASFSRSRQ